MYLQNLSFYIWMVQAAAAGTVVNDMALAVDAPQ